MKCNRSLATAMTMLVLTLMACGSLAEEETAEMGKKLQVGDRAPGFDLPGSDGATYSLAEYAGKKTVVITWFPKAFTGG